MDNNSICDTPSVKKMEAVVAFVDICGFKEFLEKDENKASEALLSLNNKLTECIKYYETSYKSEYISFQQFSDSVYIWYECNKNDENIKITHLFTIISILQYAMFVEYGLCLRGGINKGPIIVTKTLSGLSVSEAYRLESKIAEWCRVAISDEIIGLFSQKIREKYIYNDRNDSHCTVNFLNIMCSLYEHRYAPYEILDAYRKKIVPDIYDEENKRYFLSQKGQKTLGDYQETTKILLRYYDLISYFNLICTQYGCRNQIIDAPFVPDTLLSKKQFEKHLAEYDGKNKPQIEITLNSMLNTFDKR